MYSRCCKNEKEIPAFERKKGRSIKNVTVPVDNKRNTTSTLTVNDTNYNNISSDTIICRSEKSIVTDDESDHCSDDAPAVV